MMELLSYHALGSSKYMQLGMKYELSNVKLPPDEYVQKIRNIVESFGLREMTGVFLP